jgi:hypothetical protein
LQLKAAVPRLVRKSDNSDLAYENSFAAEIVIAVASNALENDGKRLYRFCFV